jgi:hypothetical protein
MRTKGLFFKSATRDFLIMLFLTALLFLVSIVSQAHEMQGMENKCSLIVDRCHAPALQEKAIATREKDRIVKR